MAILVTGGAGYIGSHMTWKLFDEGEPVVVLDDLRAGRVDVLPPSVPVVVGDIADKKLVRDTIQRYNVDAIIHFAGSVVVPDSVADPLGYYDNNSIGSHRLIEVAVEQKVKNFIFSSTAAVYGTPDETPVAEDSLLRPESPYGRSKMIVELMLRDTSAVHDLNYVILRYFNVAGADPQLRTGQFAKGATHLIKVACEVATGKRRRIEIFGSDYDTRDGTCIRDYIHVVDLVDIHMLALMRLRATGKNLVANCGYGYGYSVREVVTAVERVAGRSLKALDGPRRPGDAVAVVADASLARKVLRWTPAMNDLELIVRHALAWEMKGS